MQEACDLYQENLSWMPQTKQETILRHSLKPIKMPFNFCQVDIFGPILVYNQDIATYLMLGFSCSLSIQSCRTHGVTVRLLHPKYHQSILENICTPRYPPHHMDRSWIKYLKVWQRYYSTGVESCFSPRYEVLRH